MHVLGIDAGGTKTIALLADEHGQIVAEGRGGGANLQTGGELEVEKVLHGVIESALGRRPVTPRAICIGMAGVDRADDARTVTAIMRRLSRKSKLLVVNDALVALVAGAGDSPGIVVVSGTGSIVYGRNARNEAARAGGWGPLLADEGSGFWLGRQALVAVMRAADGRGPTTSLTEHVFAHFEVSGADELVTVIYGHELPRRRIAALGRVVQHAVDQGDPVALRIVERAAEELIRAAASVAERLEMRGEAFTFVLAGGVFAVVPWLIAELTRRLQEVAPRATVLRLQAEPATGAVTLALATARGTAAVPLYK